ncbi:MAG: hypothetical protein Q9157_000696 [Trypethelium eluteriae]
MLGPANTENTDVCLDIFGQQPRLSIHTQICLCFPIPDDFTESRLFSILTHGLERLTASFPWVGGEVVGESLSNGVTGVFKIKTSKTIPKLVIKDLRNGPSAPTRESLKQADFPMGMLDETIFAPRGTFPEAERAGESSPVFLLQANLIVGGLVLTFLGQHQTMDITGQGQVMYLLSKACHDEPFTSDELSSGNLERQSLIPLIKDYKPGPELATHLVKPVPSINGTTKGIRSPTAPPPRCVWASFVVSSASLAALKSIALKTISSDAAYVSTDDTLSAFVWQSIMRVRLARLLPTTKVTFARAVDVRGFLNIPPSYPGIVQNMTYTAYQLQKLVTLSLGEIASALRVALNPETTNLPFHTRALVTHLQSQANKSKVSPTALLDLSVDVALSSWARTDCYGLDFNLGLGLPEAVRRPRFALLEGFVYFMPRRRDGEIAVAMCLQEEDMERLKVDEQFTQFARYNG